MPPVSPPDNDPVKAQVFFDRGDAVASTGNHLYAIEMYIQGLSIYPEGVQAHQALRDISLKYKAAGGKAMGVYQKMRLPRSKDDKQKMLNAEKLPAYDPGNIDHMREMFRAAAAAGFTATSQWIGQILRQASGGP